MAKKNSFNLWLVKGKIRLTIVKELEAIRTEFHSLGEVVGGWKENTHSFQRVANVSKH